MNNFSCSSYSEYKENNNNDQYKYKKYLQNGNHQVKLTQQNDFTQRREETQRK